MNPALENKSKSTDFLKRPEFLTFVTFLVIAALGEAAKRVPGLIVPTEAVNQVTLTFFVVFVGAVFEGKYRGVDYAGGLKQLFNGRKFRSALVYVGVVVGNGLLKLIGVDLLPEETLTLVGDFIMTLIGGVAVVDGVQASRQNTR